MKKFMKYLSAAAVLTAILIMGSAAAVSAATFKQTGAGQKTITVSWGEDLGYDYYYLNYYNAVTGNSSYRYLPKGSTSGTITGLKKGTRYKVSLECWYNGSRTSTNYISCATVPGSLTTVKPTGWGNGTKGYFKMSSNPYNAMDHMQWQMYTLGGVKKSYSTTTKDGFTSDVATNQCYKLRVRGGVTVNGKVVYGPWYTKIVVPQPKLNQPSLVSGNRIRVSWRKVSGATSYVIYGSTSANSGYKKIATVGSGVSSYVVSKIYGKSLVKYKTYYTKVMAKRGKSLNSTTGNHYSSWIYTVYS